MPGVRRNARLSREAGEVESPLSGDRVRASATSPLTPPLSRKRERERGAA
jgi:hypothetical protein